MRTTLKLVLPLAVSVICVSLLYTAYQVRTERRNLRNDLARRAATLAESLQESLEALSGRSSDKNLQRIVERYGQREHLLGVAIYDRFGTPLAITPGLPNKFNSQPAAADRATSLELGSGEFFDLAGDSFYTFALPLHRDAESTGSLVVIYDTSYIEHRVSLSLRDSLLTALLQTLLITSLAFVLVRWNFTAPLASTVKWLHMLRAGSSEGSSNLPHGELFDEIHTEVKHLAHALDTARAVAQEEAQLRETQSSVWTAERLRVSLANKLGAKPLFLVSNREPYMHIYQEKSHAIQTIVPASGLVTALEPVLQACHGTWIANGSGNADRQVVDALDHLQVPPDHPAYTLRRVWLTDEEDRGYYEGFSNEGLWPLCHIAHTRPIFRLDDWLQYQKINRRFADAVLQEMAGTQSPILLAQDYHFALLPRMVKEARPDAAVAIFWHIPWPNPEVFGICPWQRELVDGLLGADLIGFHIQTHATISWKPWTTPSKPLPTGIASPSTAKATPLASALIPSASPFLPMDITFAIFKPLAKSAPLSAPNWAPRPLFLASEWIVLTTPRAFSNVFAPSSSFSNSTPPSSSAFPSFRSLLPAARTFPATSSFFSKSPLKPTASTHVSPPRIGSPSCS